jgi:2-desacetyl-2-hydroxyethyl bacteriochlorophyllide A dehydrogenase
MERVPQPASREESLNIVFSAPNQVELRREDVHPPQRGHVLIESRCSLISTGTELTCLERRFAPGTHWDEWVKYPFRPGYSAVGVVRQVGRGVRSLKQGDRVASHGPHAQNLLVAESDATAVPDAVPDDEAAWFALACIAQIGFRHVPIAHGDTVVVIGAGVLGQLAVQYARLAGAEEVVAIGRSLPRLEVVAAHGATRTLALPADEALPNVHQLTGQRGADVVLDVTGNAQVFPYALRMARRFGTVVLLGDTGYPQEQRLTSEVLVNGLRVVGAHFDHASPAEHAEMTQRFFASLQRRELRVGDLITHRVNPREAADTYSALSASPQDFLGVVFDWTLL